MDGSTPGARNERPLRVLQVEDSENDAALVLRELRRTYAAAEGARVDTPRAFEEALATDWDVILSDDRMPRFSASAALGLLGRSGKDIPFVIVSGAMGEEAAVQAMKVGASDFVSKGNLARLGQVVAREVHESGLRRDRARVLQTLRRVEQELALVLGSSRDRFFTLGADGRVTAVYGAWLAAERRRATELVGKAEREVAGVLDEGSGERWARALAGENLDYRWSRADPGGARHFETALSPIVDGGVIGAVGVVRDVTEAKRLEAQLVISDRMVSVGTLAAGVAHEINNPLACVIANLSLAAEDLRGLEGVPDDVAEEVEDALHAAEHVRAIVQDLRIFSRNEEETVGPVDVERVIDSSVRMAWNEIKHRARLEKRLGGVPRVRGTESRLGQVLLNLLVNAAQAMPEGRADANLITVTTRAPAPGWIAVAIADTGAGIRPEHKDKLFTPFFTTKPVGVGTGLGLSICQRIVAGLGGRIEIESEVGRGTTVTVTLPADEAAASTPPPWATAAAAQRGRVLVIDDDAMVRTAVRRVLAPHHDVVTEPAPQGVRRIQAGERYDVILCDLMMPILSGMDVHAAVRAVDRAQADRFVFMTAGAFTAAARAFLERTPLPSIAKPFDPESLRDAVNRALAREPRTSAP